MSIMVDITQNFKQNQLEAQLEIQLDLLEVQLELQLESKLDISRFPRNYCLTENTWPSVLVEIVSLWQQFHFCAFVTVIIIPLVSVYHRLY